MTLYDLPAPAKLNLFLHVVGRRADGYHLLESLFRLVSLSDSLTIDLRSDGRLTRESTVSASVAEEDDLVIRAARALQEATGARQGAHIAVHKRIPMGGGLGGGSSDAATVLLALNRLWRCGLNRSQLMALALPLGADVPFFLYGQTAFVTGIGEQFTPVSAPDCAYVIFQPSESVKTAAVFASHDLTRDTESVKMLDFSGRSKFIGSKVLGKKPFGANNLESVVTNQFPIVGLAQKWLSEQRFDVRLTGSGGCFFSEFDGPAEAALASERLAAKRTADEFAGREKKSDLIRSVFACDGLANHPLRNWVLD